MSEEQQPESAPAQIEEEDISFAEFLQSVPPGKFRKVAMSLVDGDVDLSGRPYRFVVALPDTQLHCSSNVCNRELFFRVDKPRLTLSKGANFEYVQYKCSNCQERKKVFAIAILIEQADEGVDVKCLKFGELPAYGPPIPPRLHSLLGMGRELFLSGRRCENQGLGIGAFAYYRRVVEDQKNRLLAEILKVARVISAPQASIAALEAAQNEQQFAKAVQTVKDAIPPSLLIVGQNPLTLLHAALSKGLHNHSDEVCLELAADIRRVLVELAELLGNALKDERELKEAVTRLRKLSASSGPPLG
jgi:hypothetical protein